jgi:hypothetical protein
MSKILKLNLTAELRAFIDQNSGDGTPYATPEEFVSDVLREKQERLEAARIRGAILDGYQDAIEGRTVTYLGELGQLMKETGG